MYYLRSATIQNALRFAPGIFSGRIIFIIAALENLRIFQSCLFTGEFKSRNRAARRLPGFVLSR